MIQIVNKKLYNLRRYILAQIAYSRFKEFTMMPKRDYIKYIMFAHEYRKIKGDVVECGVWRGGAIAGFASLCTKDKSFHLFDSFEGLPEAKSIDGYSAIEWQKNKKGPNYHDNCTADESWAIAAMKKAGKTDQAKFIKGWFDDTMPNNEIKEISILRLDGDWYDSTMTCLNHLFEKVVAGGVIIIDDYYSWDGCSKALHDYLSKHQRPERIIQLYEGGCYLIKR